MIQKWPKRQSTLTLVFNRSDQISTWQIFMLTPLSLISLPVLQLSWTLSVWTWFCPCSLLRFCVNHAGHHPLTTRGGSRAPSHHQETNLLALVLRLRKQLDIKPGVELFRRRNGKVNTSMSEADSQISRHGWLTSLPFLMAWCSQRNQEEHYYAASSLNLLIFQEFCKLGVQQPFLNIKFYKFTSK